MSRSGACSVASGASFDQGQGKDEGISLRDQGLAVRAKHDGPPQPRRKRSSPWAKDSPLFCRRHGWPTHWGWTICGSSSAASVTLGRSRTWA